MSSSDNTVSSSDNTVSSSDNTVSSSDNTVSSTLNIRDPPIRRQRLCGHCRLPGHDRRRCPDPIMVERRGVEEENRRIQRESARQRHREVREAAREAARQARDKRKSYKVHNNNPYSVYLYWSHIGSDTLTYFVWLDGEENDYDFKALPNHRIIAFPASEFSFTPTRGSEFKLSESDYFVAGDFKLGDYDDAGGHFHIIKEYEKPKTELELWKECGLKSLYLLKEIERMGGKQNPNLEAILDMVQDIMLPPHTEMDKELAGVPSVFTNIT